MFYFLFWLSLVILSLGTICYPMLLWMAARGKTRPLQTDNVLLPRLSVVIACRNEEAFIARKINNLLELDYPADRLEVVLVLNGSADRTEVILDLFLPHPQLRLLTFPHYLGQAQSWNTGMAAATGQVVVFTDARQELKTDSFRFLAAAFADESVGGVTGARADLIAPGGKESKRKDKVRLKELIRRLRYAVKTWETRIHSVTEVNESLLACRKDLLDPLPANLVLPGLAVLLQVVGQGYRLVFEPRALLYDTTRNPLRIEIERYGRIFYGYIQYLCGMKRGWRRVSPIWWQLALHNWVRLSFPLLFFLLFISNLFIAQSWFYNILLLAQLLLIGMCLLSVVFRKPLLFYLVSRFNILVIQSFYAYLTRPAAESQLPDRPPGARS